jgi:opacity protein-like surface antigen
MEPREGSPRCGRATIKEVEMPLMPFKTIVAASVAALVTAASPALSGGLAAPEPAPAVIVPAPVVAPSYDWTGPYLGAQLGWGWADASPGIESGDNWIGGLHGGYRWDFGTWVAGGELEYNWTDIDLEGPSDDANVSGVFNVKATAGVEAGPGLFYGIVGWSQAQVDGNYDALIGGLGLAYPINDRWVASGEWLYYGFDDYGLDEADSAWANTLTLRVSYQF